MECKEFSEISEAYLSDELLVETNIKVFSHMENCPKCRREFAARKEFRKQTFLAVRNTPEFQIRADFAEQLRDRLKRESNGVTISWFSIRFLIPAFASLLLVVGLGLVAVNFIRTGNENGQLSVGLAQIAAVAAVRHNDCALQKLELWDKWSKVEYDRKQQYEKDVLEPLRAGFSEKIEMLHVHDCEYKNKQFTHVILRNGENIVSVFVDKTDDFRNENPFNSEQIITEEEEGLRVASFGKNNRAVFVISDMSETENISAARAIVKAIVV